VTVSAAPDRDTLVGLRDGRRVALAEWGDVDGRPVFVFQGSPGSRLFNPDVETTEATGVRILSPDRPGYGTSDPKIGRSVLDWASDLGEIADALGLDRFPVLGWSSGGQFALGVAVGLGERVTSVALVAADGPPFDVPGVRESWSPEVAALVDLIRADPAAARVRLLERQRWYADDPGSIIRRADAMAGDDPDAVLRRIPAIRGALDTMFREGARQGSAGFVDDLIAYYSPWGFSPADVRQPTSVWWGDEDLLVARSHTDYLATTIPGARLHVEPGEGHLLPVRHWAAILAELDEAS